LTNIVKENKLRRVRWTKSVVGMGEIRNAYTVLAGKPEWKSIL
jgi:hypothetical protein